MKPLAALLFLIIAVAAGSARAGDTAELFILGFTADGSIFAFEEYGVQDGSGFAYANRFYINTATDSFVTGTPIRVRIDEDNASVEDARNEAHSRGQAIVKDAELASHRGFVAGFNAIGEISADPHRLAVNPRPVTPAIDDPLEFRLEETHLDQPERCRDLGDTMGFRLLRIGTKPEATTQLVHEDKSIPASRNCPLGYRIGAVQTFFPKSGAPVYAVLIAVRSFGFEGPDHRWIAVPGSF
jgi:predicted secreted protein